MSNLAQPPDPIGDAIREVTGQRYGLYGRESPTNAAGRAEEEGRDTPFDTQFAEMRTHVAEQRGTIEIERKDVWWRNDIWGRPGLDEIRECVRQHKIDVLLVHSVERLATGKQLAYILAECELHGVRVEFVHGQSFDPDDPLAPILQAAYEFAADWEHKRIRERTQRGLRTLLAAGRPVGTGRVRYGLVWRTKTINEGTDKEKAIKIGYDAHPERSKVVIELFRRAKEGATTRTQVQELHDASIPSPTGKEWWTPTVIRNILHDRIYTGMAENLRWKQTKERKQKGGRLRSVTRARPEDERQRLPEGTAPCLVTEEDFEAVQRILIRNQAESSRRSRWPDATPLRGFASCANCGRRLYVHPIPRNRYPQAEPGDRPLFVLRCLRYSKLGQKSLSAPDAQWGCTPWAHTEVLEAEVWGALVSRLDEPAIRADAAAAPTVGEKEQADVDAISARLVRLEKDIALRERQVRNTDPETEPETFALFKGDLERFRAEHTGAQKERDDRRAALDAARADVLAWEQIRQEWRDTLRDLPASERVIAYRALQLKVWVWPDDPAKRPPGAPRWEADANLSVAGLGLIRLREGDGAAIVDQIRGYSIHNMSASFPLRLRPAERPVA